MVDLGNHHLFTRTTAGYVLWETLSYCLFGELGVYQAREDMKKACFYARHDVVSLDDDDEGNSTVKRRKLMQIHIHCDQILKEDSLQVGILLVWRKWKVMM